MTTKSQTTFEATFISDCGGHRVGDTIAVDETNLASAAKNLSSSIVITDEDLTPEDLAGLPQQLRVRTQAHVTSVRQEASEIQALQKAYDEDVSAKASKLAHDIKAIRDKYKAQRGE